MFFYSPELTRYLSIDTASPLVWPCLSASSSPAEVHGKRLHLLPASNDFSSSRLIERDARTDRKTDNPDKHSPESETEDKMLAKIIYGHTVLLWPSSLPSSSSSPIPTGFVVTIYFNFRLQSSTDEDAIHRPWAMWSW